MAANLNHRYWIQVDVTSLLTKGDVKVYEMIDNGVIWRTFESRKTKPEARKRWESLKSSLSGNTYRVYDKETKQEMEE